jgi:hypothetical protein
LRAQDVEGAFVEVSGDRRGIDLPPAVGIEQRRVYIQQAERGANNENRDERESGRLRPALMSFDIASSRRTLRI